MRKIYTISTLLLMSVYFINCGDDGKNDNPNPKTMCDSLQVTYASHVKSIIDVNCNTVGCHSAGAGGVGLGTYVLVKDGFENGNCMKCIKWQTGVPKMPKDKPQLSARNIAIIQCWIDGAYKP